MAKKNDYLNWIIILIIVLVVFVPRPLDEGTAADIARDALYKDPSLTFAKSVVDIDFQKVESDGVFWRVHAKVNCKPTAERAKTCAHPILADRGVTTDYYIYVDKISGETTVVSSDYSTIA